MCQRPRASRKPPTDAKPSGIMTVVMRSALQATEYEQELVGARCCSPSMPSMSAKMRHSIFQEPQRVSERRRQSQSHPGRLRCVRPCAVWKNFWFSRTCRDEATFNEQVQAVHSCIQA